MSELLMNNNYIIQNPFKNHTLVCNTARCTSCRFKIFKFCYRNAMHRSYSLFCKSFRILGTLCYEIWRYSSTTSIRIVRNDYIRASTGLRASSCTRSWNCHSHRNVTRATLSGLSRFININSFSMWCRWVRVWLGLYPAILGVWRPPWLPHRPRRRQLP